MRFGNFLFPASMKPADDARIIDETLREARLCDELGMDMLWLAEHHFYGICAYVDPVSFAAAIAASTRRIRIGFAVAQMSLHHPIRMAEQMSLIDNISKGRLLIGLGRGTAYNIYDYQGYGIDPEEAHARLVEAEEVMIKAWTHPNLVHEREILAPTPATASPSPLYATASAAHSSVLGGGVDARNGARGSAVSHERAD